MNYEGMHVIYGPCGKDYKIYALQPTAAGSESQEKGKSNE